MRSSLSTSMQKTYDECFLTCSTAVYFESQNNEAEALRSWKSALDQIYYHNAHRVPSYYRAKSSTEAALQESLRQLELQCKERVDLLEALKRSREDSNDSLTTTNSGAPATAAPTPPPHGSTRPPGEANGSEWLGGGTVPPIDYGDLYRPPLPKRPSLQPRKSSNPDSIRKGSIPQDSNGSTLSPPAYRKETRTPSPEKKGRFLRTLRPGGGKDGRPTSSKMQAATLRPDATKAAKLATSSWNTSAATSANRPPLSMGSSSTSNSQNATPRQSIDRPTSQAELGSYDNQSPVDTQPPKAPPFYFRTGEPSGPTAYTPPPATESRIDDLSLRPQVSRKDMPTPTSQRNSFETRPVKSSQSITSGLLTYRNEYPTPAPDLRAIASSAATRSWSDLDNSRGVQQSRKPINPYQATQQNSNIRAPKPRKSAAPEVVPVDEDDSPVEQKHRIPVRRKQKAREDTLRSDIPDSPASEVSESPEESTEWKEKTKHILKNLPRGVDEQAAQQILNEIVIQGDEVHWDDVAGLEVAKSALKETVVYPFLRPDLFMGLREPARGMLLFGPPGTGKTMLARAVATESRSTFFAISASSLTSKFLGESEKLVRALFALAKMLAPSIIFVDEIDSLLSSRSGSGEHEATRRIKTEFLIQWSDLAKAAAGRETTEKDKEKGDASRVLVLAATNLPWAIDEAARRRFVRRQYIPLPEDHVRRSQLKTLLSHQKHEVNEEDMDRLVDLTEGFSGSDITALAKDAAMGPLRSLGEKLLHMTMDEIRPMRFEDFQASLINIRPSVSKQGLQQFEDWAREFGERGG
ncbi:P-loop containing nucleoside triphosphate hydrolase protein [Lophiotrema nucula]|uniref:P-loop containing nucleoside triphosphate hydrolase protein n=1 Tax=Lophiotrema nucula TaxID=690887 RepID=A0A6A5ZRG3_9PLEO|nr:P-loop containing nucleoside triphosphate hydrolase protein [Lophiotrema nucula]